MDGFAVIEERTIGGWVRVPWNKHMAYIGTSLAIAGMDIPAEEKAERIRLLIGVCRGEIVTAPTINSSECLSP